MTKTSGLGLNITKETIAKLGGTIQVESEYGSWTKFKIIIPNQTPYSESSKDGKPVQLNSFNEVQLQP